MTAFTKPITEVIPEGAAPSTGNMRVWGQTVETIADSVVEGTVATGVTVWFATKAAMDADLAHDANTLAGVHSDSTAAYNVAYVKLGASGAGSWVQWPADIVAAFQTDLDAVETIAESAEIGLGLLASHQNVIPDAAFSDLTYWESSAGVTDPTFSAVDGWDTALFAANETWFTRVSIGEVPAATFSWSAWFQAASSTPGGAVSVVQVDSGFNVLATSQVLLSGKTPDVKVGALDVAVNGSTYEFWFVVTAPAGSTISVSRGAILVGGGPNAFRPSLPSLINSLNPPIVYMDPAGDDANSGTFAAPMATLGAIVSRYAGRARVKLLEGDYAMTDFVAAQTDIQHIEVTGVNEGQTSYDAATRVIGGTALTGASATGGYSNVYEISLATAPVGDLIHEWDEPYYEITAAQRHPLHLSETHLARHGPMTLVGDSDEVESTPGSWFWDDPSDTLFLHCHDSGDASSRTFYVPATNPFPVIQAANRGKGGFIRLANFQMLFMSQMVFQFSEYAELEDMYLYGSGADNVRWQYCNGYAKRCMSVAAALDGYGIHSSLAPRGSMVTVEDSAGFLCDDDAVSNHGTTYLSVRNFLAHESRDAGATVAGGPMFVDGLTAIGCGWGVLGGGNAALIDSTCAGEAIGSRTQSALGGTVLARNVHALNCYRGAFITGAAEPTLRIENSLFDGCNYVFDVNTSGTLTHKACEYLNGGTLKTTSGTGTIVDGTGTLIT